MIRPFPAVAAAMVATFLGALPAPAQHNGMPFSATAAPPPLYQDLGNWHRDITTRSDSAQRYFDQGLRLMYSFNLEEAQRAFETAARFDAECAACWWGVGLSLGPHINYPATPERTVAGHRAVQKALIAREADPVEKALAEALAMRYSDPAPSTPEGAARLERAYCDAMRQVANRFPQDVDVASLFCESLMDLHPWDLYTSEGKAKPWTPEIVSTLEAALARTPDHPGANHLYIHAVEASPRPERAIPAADRLRTAIPGAAHMVHMPGHIYQRVGRYADAMEANRRAIEADRAFVGVANPQGFYLMYVAHNYQFLWFSAGFAGCSREATEAIERAAKVIPVEMHRAMPGNDFFLAYPIWTDVRFGRWEQALAQPAPPADFPYATGAWHAARGLALLGTGKVAEARRAHDSVIATAQALPAEATEGLNPARLLMGIARDLLGGEIAAREKRWNDAVKLLESAVKAEDGLRYNEPSDWYYPVRHHLGAVLLDAGRPKQAQAVYEADLQRHPENGWSLIGLAEALRRQQKDAAAVEKRFDAAWKNADFKLARSRM